MLDWIDTVNRFFVFSSTSCIENVTKPETLLHTILGLTWGPVASVKFASERHTVPTGSVASVTSKRLLVPEGILLPIENPIMLKLLCMTLKLLSRSGASTSAKRRREEGINDNSTWNQGNARLLSAVRPFKHFQVYNTHLHHPIHTYIYINICSVFSPHLTLYSYHSALVLDIKLKAGKRLLCLDCHEDLRRVGGICANVHVERLVGSWRGDDNDVTCGAVDRQPV